MDEGVACGGGAGGAVAFGVESRLRSLKALCDYIFPTKNFVVDGFVTRLFALVNDCLHVGENIFARVIIQ